MSSKHLYLLLGLLCILSFQNCSDVGITPTPPPARTINLKIESYCPSPGYKFSEIFAVNLSTYLENDNVIADTDRDGLSDKYENDTAHRDTYNISLSNDDTAGNGYSDLVMVTLGYDVDTQSSLEYCDSPYQDSDRDLLEDCAEALIGTELNNPDSDNDGIPDGLEFRYGLNPRDGEDSKTDFDQDGLNSLIEVKTNTPLRNTNSERASSQATSYVVESYLNEDDQSCYSIEVNNIMTANVNNGNFIKVIFVETTLVPEQGDVSVIRDISVVVSNKIISTEHLIVSEVNNQTEIIGIK